MVSKVSRQVGQVTEDVDTRRKTVARLRELSSVTGSKDAESRDLF